MALLSAIAGFIFVPATVGIVLGAIQWVVDLLHPGGPSMEKSPSFVILILVSMVAGPVVGVLLYHAGVQADRRAEERKRRAQEEALD